MNFLIADTLHQESNAAQIVEIHERVEEVVVPRFVDAPPYPTKSPFHGV